MHCGLRTFIAFAGNKKIFLCSDEINMSAIEEIKVKKKDGQQPELTAEQAAEANELMLQAYAEYLEGLKETDPTQYKKVMDDLMSKSPGALEKKLASEGISLPGGKKMKDGEVSSSVQAQGMDVTPDPGFVVKTKNLKSGNKVFINICVSSHLANLSKKVQLMEDGTEQEGINIPMSVGPPRPDKDKSGNSCLVFDMIVNPEVVKDSKEDKTGGFRHFLCEIAIQRIENKYKTQLDRRYKLPKMKYKGKPASQRIRKETKPAIEVIDPEQAAADAAKKRIKKQKEAARKKREALGPITHAAYDMFSRDVLGGNDDQDDVESSGWVKIAKPGKGTVPNPCILDPGMEEQVPAQLLLSIQLPKLSTIYDNNAIGDVNKGSAPKEKQKQKARVHVGVSSWMVSMRAQGYYALEVILPFPVFRECKCHFDQTKRVLKVYLTVDIESMDFDPVLPPTATAEDRPGPDPGSQPWLLVQALEDSYGDAPGAKNNKEEDREEFPEEKFHLLPDDPVDPENDILPEDRFIKDDLISQHYIKQKEDGKREKLEQAEQRREENKDDPNIVRVGYDDEDDKPKPVVVQNEMDKVAKRDVVQGVKLAPSKLEGDPEASGDNGIVLENDLIFDLLD